jgi:hypothetical protein
MTLANEGLPVRVGPGQVGVAFQTGGITHTVRNFSLEEIGTRLSELVPEIVSAEAPLDVFVRGIDTGVAETRLPRSVRREVTLLGAMNEATKGGTVEGLMFIINVAPEHVGAGDSGEDGWSDTPEVVLTESCQEYIRLCCRQTDAHVARLEIPWEMYGVMKGSCLVCTHAVIPVAECTEVTFRVDPADLSDVGRFMSARHPRLKPLVHAHRHPSSAAPAPSGTDERDRKQMGSLFRVFNRREVSRWRRIRAELESGSALYRIDPGTEARLEGRLVKNGTQVAAAPSMRVSETASVSYQGFVIFNCFGDPSTACVEVMEYRTSHDPARPEVTLYRDCPLRVLPDDEVAALVGLPVGEVRCEVDPAQIRIDVKERVKPDTWYGKWGSNAFGSGDSYAQGGSTESRAGNSGAGRSSESRPDHFSYLTPRSSRGEAATLLREAAALVEGQTERGSWNYFDVRRTSDTDLTQALREVSWVLSLEPGN